MYCISIQHPEKPMQVGPLKGRGSLSNRVSRFQAYTRHAVSDDWAWPRGTLEDAATPADVHNVVQAVVTDPPTVRPVTTVSLETARSIISRNTSPDIPFDQSINTYRGCEHGCIYCYARPSHAYLDLSPCLDIETRLYAKTNAPKLLRTEHAPPGYVPQHVAMGTTTDHSPPMERR